MRWKNPDKVEITNWADVLAALPIDAAELAEIRRALFAFSGKIDTLEDVMAKKGVDDDITHARHYSIQTQRDQLRELSTPGKRKG